MKKLIIILFIITIFGLGIGWGESSSKIKNELTQGNTTQLKTTKEYLLDKESVGYGKLGMKFEEFLKYIKYDKIVKDEYWWHLYKNNKVFMSINDKNRLSDKIVRFVVISGKEYSTEKGIYVGMSLKEFSKIYPSLPLTYGVSDDYEEYFVPEDLRTKESTYLIRTKSTDGKPLIINDEPIENQKRHGNSLKYRKNGYISSIYVLY